MLAARLLARDLRRDLACAEGAHLRAEGVELAIVLHCMNEHGARAPPWRQEASPRSFYSRPHSMPRLLLETQRGRLPPVPSVPAQPPLCRQGRRCVLGAASPLAPAPAALQWPVAALTIAIPAASCDS